MAKIVFWFWLIILLLLNVMPLGKGVNENLTGHSFVFRLDYLLHLLTFACFGVVYFVGWKWDSPIFKRREVLLLLSIISLAAVGFEGIQYFLPYRAWNPLDLISNLTGVAISFLIIALTTHWTKDKGSSKPW